MEINERTRLRRRAGLTQVQLGRRAGMSGSQICLWERGELEFSAEDVTKIADVLEIEINRIPVPKTREGIVRALAQVSV